MKRICLMLIVLLFSTVLISQQNVTEPENAITTNQLEEYAEDDEVDTEHDYDAQQMHYLARHPLDINGSELEQLPVLGELLISNLTAYRKLLGDIIDLHELQAVPGFTIEIIRSILPYITLTKAVFPLPSLRRRFTKGDHSILIRSSMNPEIAEGFRTTSDHRFTGDRLALFIRYKYQSGNLLQFGFAADKDAGEKFAASGGVWPDFTSYHFFAREIGVIRSFALGDYTINLGQGLIHWQSQAFRRSSSVLNIRRQSEILRPYVSAGEYNFHRGIAATIGRRSHEITVFFSRKNLTANIDSGVITSVITSGLHRTIAELKDRNRSALFMAGAALKQKFKKGHVGLNWAYHLYSLPVMKRDELYNLFAFKGREWNNMSTDYSYVFRNFYFFGEFAIDNKWRLANVHGLMSSLSRAVDIALLYRNISRSYTSVFGNAFTENTMPSNEHGFYSGIRLKPHLQWEVNIYADLFSFSWLKYRLDAPSGGFAYLIQLSWKPNRQTEIYSRYRYRIKPLNIEDDEEEITVPGIQMIQNWRTHISRQVSRAILLRSRVERCLFDHQYLARRQEGYLFYTDLVYKPLQAWFSGNLRFQAFEADSYDTRIYAYENDLLFVSNTPAYYNRGVRCYLNLKAKVKVNVLGHSGITISLKLATTIYNNIHSIGSGAAAIPRNHISSLKLQALLNS